jgi:hypothetical protein
MARRTITAEGREYRISEDDAARPEQLWWAVLRTRVVDELTGLPPRSGVRVTTRTPHCIPRAGADGIVGLAARPRDVSTALTTPGALTAEVSADGYLPRSLDSAIDAARRRLPNGAAIGVRMLDVLPLDAPREQFPPGRGVALQRNASAEAEQFTLVADPIAPPAANEVPLVDAVAPARPIDAAVAGIPLVLPDQPLHLAAVAVLRGRATRPGGLNGALAAIGIDGLWWTQREVLAQSNPPHPPRLVSFGAPLAFEHAQGAPVRACTLTPADGVMHRLQARAHAGAQALLLSPWSALDPAGGEVLEIEQANSHERELVVTDSFSAPADPALPAAVRLRTPLVFSHGPAAPAFRRNVAALPAGSLEREAQRGDRVLFMTAAVAADSVLRLEPGTARDELRFVRALPTFAAGVALATDGSFEFPPLARVAQVRLRARYDTAAELPAIDCALEYRGDNTVHVQFT